MELYNKICFSISKKITNTYSTSFSLGIRLFAKEFQSPIYGLYGFVRLADEIVDTFHEYDKAKLLNQFREDTHTAIKEGISVNPVLNAFQCVAKEYSIPLELIDAFLDSMAMDLEASSYQKNEYDKYVYGSAEVVGLMCLKIFCKNNNEKYSELAEPARLLGSSFQKVNFLRDIKSDIEERGRIYLPGVNDIIEINDENKRQLEEEIEKEFTEAFKGIINLPIEVQLGVYTAFLYYKRLFHKIRGLSADELKKRRVRLSDTKKIFLLIKSFLKIKILRLT